MCFCQFPRISQNSYICIPKTLKETDIRTCEMFANGCVACPGPPSSGSVAFWPPGEGPAASAAAAIANNPYAAAVYSEAIKRTSFYISDILYPSVIPLPGTLPSHLAGLGTGSGRSMPYLKESPISTPTSPPVKSKDLKFGIDRILDENNEKIKTPLSKYNV